MSKTILKIKKLDSNAVIPSYAHPGDAGLDLTATSKTYNPLTRELTFGTGLAFEIPDGHVGLIFPRSSVCKTNLILKNSVGVIDSKYRGEVKFKFGILDVAQEVYNVGDRIGQMLVIPFPNVEIQEAEELTSTERGTGGFGSTGK